VYEATGTPLRPDSTPTPQGQWPTTIEANCAYGRKFREIFGSNMMQSFLQLSLLLNITQLCINLLFCSIWSLNFERYILILFVIHNLIIYRYMYIVLCIYCSIKKAILKHISFICYKFCYKITSLLIFFVDFFLDLLHNIYMYTYIYVYNIVIFTL